MKNYWFYIEPYTFIFKGRQGFLVYNSLNGSAILVDNGQKLATQILDSVDMEESGYCTIISGKLMQNKEVSSFVRNIKNTFCGDIIDCNLSQEKPFIIKPILNLLNDPQKSELSKDMFQHDNLLSYIHDISIYLHSTCKLSCKHCNDYYKQCSFCTLDTGKQVLDIADYNSLFMNLKTIGIKKIKLITGGGFIPNFMDEIVQLIISFNFEVQLFIHYENLNFHMSCDIDYKNNLHFVILSNCPLHENKIIEIQRKISLKNILCHWSFIVASEQELNNVNKLLDNNGFSADIIPFYNKENIDFFEKFVYSTIDDILERPISKKQIFSRQILNEALFGKISIMPNGDVYANVNNHVLGNLMDNSLNEIIYNEIRTDDSWLSIRNQGVCSDCVFRYLCPSPGNYELNIGKSNLCNVKKFKESLVNNEFKHI